jgi:hypothetical protein
VSSRHWFVLVGGINGAGKTTLAQSRPFLQLFGVHADSPVEIINPDLVTQRIREQAPTSRLDDVNLRAAKVCESRVRAPWFWADADHAMVLFNGWSPATLPLLIAWKKDAAVWFLEGAPGPGLIADLKAARTSGRRPTQ